ncbi:MAG: GerMN domain-containing protein [Anaerolineaceae bacterium]
MKKQTKQKSILLSFLILWIVSGCLGFSKDLFPGFKVDKASTMVSTEVSVVNTVAVVETLAPTATPIVITATPEPGSPTPIPTETAEPTQTSSPTASVATAEIVTQASVLTPTPISNTQTLKIFLVAIGDNGVSGKKIGCDDSLVAVDVGVQPTVAVLRSALTRLLEIKTSYYGESGLYNALYQSDLEIENLSIQNGLASIYLKGDLMLGGTCDSPRVDEQLKATALQFSTISNVEIFINGIPLAEKLSLK